MTIGPAPMIRMVSRSVRLGMLAHQCDEALEEILAVLRSGAGFRMVLHRKYRLADDSQTLVGAVEERDVGRLDAVRQAVGIDDEAVVLAGDLNGAADEVLDRV